MAGQRASLYGSSFNDPRYLTTVINTLVYVGVGVNVKMSLAFLLSGFFMRKGWWTKALIGDFYPALGDTVTARLHVHPLVPRMGSGGC